MDSCGGQSNAVWAAQSAKNQIMAALRQELGVPETTALVTGKPRSCRDWCMGDMIVEELPEEEAAIGEAARG